MQALKDVHKEIDVVEFAEMDTEGLLYTRLSKHTCPYVVRCHMPFSIYHNYRVQGHIDPWLVYLERRFISDAQVITAPSQCLAGDLVVKLGLDPARITVIPYPVDTVVFQPDFSERQKIYAINFLFVGALVEEKGIFVLLEALNHVCRQIPRVRLLIVGGVVSGKAGCLVKERLNTLMTKYQLQGHVEFLGTVPHQNMPTIYRLCDVCVVPSFYETFGIASIEAMACSKPVIASRVGGIPEVVVDGETGLLVPPRDPQALSEAMLALAQDQVLRRRMGETGRAWVKERFDVLTVAQQNLRLYADLLG